jgi:nitrate/nitrite transport system ATP-binding protein
VAESVEITIPRPRRRTEIVEHPNYYAIRNHLVHFLGQRSRELAGQQGDGADQRPEPVRIDRTEPAEPAEPAEDDGERAPRLLAVND